MGQSEMEIHIKLFKNLINNNRHELKIALKKKKADLLYV